MRDLLGIDPGAWSIFSGRRMAALSSSSLDESPRPSRFARLRGHAGKGLSTDAILAMTRGEV